MKFLKLTFILLLLNHLTLLAQDSIKIPDINAQIVAYVKTVVGKKVDRGECWDLANQALTRANAKWTFPTQFGKEINPNQDSIYPGDIMQFTNVKMKNRKGETWTFPKHTAIVYEVTGEGQLIIAEQNINGNRKVQLDEFVLRDKASGKLQFFRPIPK